MSIDYKWLIQEKAEQIAEEDYSRDFYDLPSEIQDKVYEEASEVVWESLQLMAEKMEDQLERKEK